MDSISRRRFLRDASLGAVAVGAAAAVGRQGLASSASKQARAASALGPGAALVAGAGNNDMASEASDEVMAHVVGGPSGTVEIYAGTKSVTLHDRGVANALLAALG